MNKTKTGFIMLVVSTFAMFYFFGVLESFSIMFFVLGMILYFKDSVQHDIHALKEGKK